MIEIEKSQEETSAGKMLNLIKRLTSTKNTGSANNGRSFSARFEYYETQNPFMDNAPTFVEYLSTGVSQERGFLRGQIIELLFSHDNKREEYSVSRVVSVKRVGKKLFVLVRFDSEISFKRNGNQEFFGEIPQEIVYLLPATLKIDPQDAAERQLTDEEIEKEITKAENLKLKWLNNRD